MAKILILTSKTGGGHVSLAEALRDRLQHRHTIEIVDPQPALIHWHYRLVSRHALWLWAAEFKLADTPARSLQAHQAFTRLFARNVSDLLRRAAPDAVMTTYPFLTYEITQAMKQIKRHIPLLMLFSDPNGVHQAWLTERGAAANLAPTRETQAQALNAGFDPARLHLSGWPVRGQFYRTFSAADRAGLLRQLNLDPERFVICLQGGGEGAAKFARTVENVLRVKGQPQIILVAGTNKALFARFSGLPNIAPLPFTKDIAPYMAAADVVMGKAGPNTLFEAVTLGRPFIATAYIPGQEEVNLEFIERHGLGWVALGADSQWALIERLMVDDYALKTMAESVDNYRRWNNELLETILPVTESVIGKK
jgi:UDP-N-acetylglucosamine:LPS N-acetylglucosamine transferase